MDSKEKYLKIIKDFSAIEITDILKKLNIDSGGFYTRKYSIENMQRVTNELKKQLKNWYIELENDNLILNTKEKNINFVKEIKEIKIKRICDKLNIKKNSLYVYEASDLKYELVIDELKKQLNLIYKKYSKTP